MKRVFLTALIVFIASQLLCSCSSTEPPPASALSDATEAPELDMADPLLINDPFLTTKINDAAMGAQLFRAYCVNCHGEDGRGDGPITSVLSIHTPDLTVLARNNDGEFPRDLIQAQIDGTEHVLPHGSGLMPVWGVVLNPDFRMGGHHNGREVALRQIEALVAHVRDIQE